MADIGKFTLTYTGVFDYYAIYYYCIEWLESRRFSIQYGLYKDKAAGAGLREKEFKLSGSVNVDEYYRWGVKIEMLVLDSAEVSVDLPDGTKKIMVRGKARIIINASVDEDYKGRFATPFQKKIKNFLSKTIHKSKFDSQQWFPLYTALAGFNQDLKKILYTDTAMGSFDKAEY